MTSVKGKRRHLGGVKTVMLAITCNVFFCVIFGCSNDRERCPDCVPN